jgi:hypothetical protein
MLVYRPDAILHSQLKSDCDREFRASCQLVVYRPTRRCARRRRTEVGILEIRAVLQG